MKKQFLIEAKSFVKSTDVKQVALTTCITMPLFVKWFGGWLLLPKQAPL